MATKWDVPGEWKKYPTVDASGAALPSNAGGLTQWAGDVAGTKYTRGSLGESDGRFPTIDRKGSPRGDGRSGAAPVAAARIPWLPETSMVAWQPSIYMMPPPWSDYWDYR